MTQEFFEQVKDKKIYWTGWEKFGYRPNSYYFIPVKLVDDIMYGHQYKRGYNIGTGSYTVSTGFKYDKNNERWMIIEEFKEVSTKCICDMQNLIIQGCQCGGN